MKKAILTLMLLFILAIPIFSTVHTYAYWDANNKISNTVTLLIGNWEVIPVWSKGTVYSIGNKVIYQGQVYTSLRNKNTKIPGSNGSATWWQLQ